jgi:hypothetical protein
MKGLLSILFFCSANLLFSQTTSTIGLFSTIPIGSRDDEIAYINGMSNWSPRSFDFIDGRRVWIAGSNNAKIYDIWQKKVVKIIVAPQSPIVDVHGDISNSDGFFLSGNHFVAENSELVLGTIDEKSNSISWYHREEGVSLASSFYQISGYFCFYDKEGFIHAVKDEGPSLDNTSTVAMLIRTFEKTWYSDEHLKDIHREMLKSGKYLIYNGLFYPKDDWQLSQYFNAVGIHWMYPEIMKENPRFSRIIYGMDLDGHIYMSFGYDTKVYSQGGKELAQIHDPGVAAALPESSMTDFDFSTPTTRINTNGDLYFSYAVAKDNMYIYRAPRTWGADYKVLANKGIAKADAEKMRNTLQDYNNSELRILRNAFFALQGYDFQSWDLKSFFNCYDWYEPRPGVKADPATLDENQKRLFDLVVVEEARRK